MPERRLRRLLRIPRSSREQAESDLRAEIELHLDLRAAELESEGLSPAAARSEAERLFGGDEARRALVRAAARGERERRGLEAMGDMMRDVRYAVRTLVRAPAFTVVAVLTLGLGIGANTAIWSMVDAVLLEPLPLPEPDRLAMVWEAFEAQRGPEDRNVVSPVNVNDWRERTTTFSQIAAFFTLPTTVLSDAGAREVPLQLVHPEFFQVLGAQPRAGRTFVPEDAGTRVVVVSHGFWRDHFGGDPDAVGRTFELPSGAVEVIGVMGPELDFLAPEVAFWSPTNYSSYTRQNSGRFARAVGRLAPGASMEAAHGEMRAIMAQLAEEDPEFNEGFSANVVPLDEQIKGDVRPALLVLLGAVVVLLLVTCVNLANLMLVRAASRRSELAVRASLGAGRGRIVRGLLTESLLLAAAGLAVGLALAWGVTRALATALPAALEVPRLDQASLDPGVLLFAAALAVGTAFVFGLAPAFEAFRTDLVGQLREGGRGSGGGRRAGRLRAAVVVGEVALSLMLLIGGGLLLRSFAELSRQDLGVRAENVLTGRVTMQGSRYQTATGRVGFLAEATDAVTALPEVTAAGAIAWLPLRGAWSATAYWVADRPRPERQDMLGTEVQAVEGDIFRALGTPVLQGRTFTPADNEDAPRVAVVNRAFAAQSWPGEDPIGKRFILPWHEELDLEVVGVVGDIRQRGVETEPEPGVFISHAQIPTFGSFSLIIRASGDPAAVTSRVVARIGELDPNIAVADVATMESVVADAIARPRFTSLVVGAFAALALLLAALGIYGVLAYAVSLRGQELSIRQALGARSADVARLVLREAVLLALLGVAIGAAIAFFATRVLESQLYQVGTRDPVVFLGMSGLILLIAAVAGAVPALRAARVSPAEAIRDE